MSQQLFLFSSNLQSLLCPWLLDPQDSSVPVATGRLASQEERFSDGIFEPWQRKKGMVGRAMVSQQVAPRQWDDPFRKTTSDDPI